MLIGLLYEVESKLKNAIETDIVNPRPATIIL